MVSSKTIKIIYNNEVYTLKKQGNNYYLNDEKINTRSLQDIQNDEDTTNLDEYESFIEEGINADEALLVINLRSKMTNYFSERDMMWDMIEEFTMLLKNNAHLNNNIEFIFEPNDSTNIESIGTLFYLNKSVTFPTDGSWIMSEKIHELLS